MLTYIKTMPWLLVGFILLTLLLMLYLVARPKVGVTPTGGITVLGHPATKMPISSSSGPSSVSGTMATVDVPPVPSTPQSPVLVPVATLAGTRTAQPPPVSKLVKRIRITKTTDPNAPIPPGENDGWRTFQIGEIYVYSDGRTLGRSDFSGAKYIDTTGSRWMADFSIWGALDGDLRSFAHTCCNEPVQAMEFTLAVPTSVQKIDVFNRQDCCQSRLLGAVLELFDESGNKINSLVLSGQSTQTFVIV